MGLPENKAVTGLYLDPQNPRLADYDLTVDDQDKIAQVLWQDRAVNEIVDSIASSGYWTHEELFAANEHGKLIVIEGNRRLTAVKLLTDNSLAQRIGASGIPTISDEEKGRLRLLPVITCTREDLWQYVGFKHVNGPQDWDSIAKAEYIARVHNDYHVSLDEIAHTIGDRHDTVRRLYRGLMVLKQAEDSGVFNREDRFNSRFAYSHLWTALGYSGFQEFLGLKPDQGFRPTPVSKKALPRLGEVCYWLYGSRDKEKPPIVRSQNPDLRNLDEVLKSRDGVAALRNNLQLETALKASRGDERLLLEAMVLVEQKIKEARGLLVTGYSGDSELLKKSEVIYRIAESIHEEMKDIHNEKGSRKSRRRRERL